MTRCIDEWTGFTPTVGEIRKFIPQEKVREHVDSPAFDYEQAKREHEKNMQDPEWRAAMEQLSSAFKNARSKSAMESKKDDKDLEARRAELRRQAEEIGKRFGGGNA